MLATVSFFRSFILVPVISCSTALDNGYCRNMLISRFFRIPCGVSDFFMPRKLNHEYVLLTSVLSSFVRIYIDPMHGTFVFNTTAGQSKCPHENNTNPVELPSVSVIQPENPVVQLDEPMVFELEIANHGYGDSSFVLYHEVLDNPDGLMINTFSSDTRTWILPSTYHGGTATKTTLTVSRGPKLNVYSPVRIYLQSKCGFALENGDSINEAVLYNKIVANDDGTSSKFIEFTESCQEVQWSSSSSLGKYKTFLLNTKSEKIMPITIQNPSSVPLQNKEKLKSVGLQYRKASEGFHEWIDGLQSDGKKINFKKNTEDFLGFITSEWKYPLIDGIYEIRLKSTCDCERCPLFLKEYTSESVFGYVDLTPPRVFGEPTPAGNLSPGEAVTIDFTEDIDCGIPYSFDVWIEVSEITSIIFGNIDLDIICSKNSIILKFRKDRIPAKTLKQLLGRSYILSVEGVKDKSGNIMEERFIFNSNFECLPPKPELKISFNRSREYLPHEPMIFDITISNKQWNWESNVAELQMDVSLQLS